MTDDGGLDIIGIGLADSRGIRRGVVVNLEAAVESIKKAIDEAELTAGVEIDSVHLGLSGAHVKAFNSRGVVAVAGKNREITREDVRRAIDAAKAVALPSGREILHVLPQDFVVDEQDGIGAPVGMTGSRLEVNVHVVTGSASSTQNIVACVNRAGVAVRRDRARAAGRERGGADRRTRRSSASRSSTSAAARPTSRSSSAAASGTPAWSRSAAITSPTTSRSGCARRSPTPRRSSAAAAARCRPWSTKTRRWRSPSVGGRKPRVMARRILSEILQPRAEEIFHLLWDEIRKRRLREVAQLRHRADRRRRDARGHGGDRRADFRPADPPRRARRRRRARRPRQQPGVRDRRRPGDVRAPQPRRRSRRARSAPARSGACRTAARLVQGILADRTERAEWRDHARTNDG